MQWDPWIKVETGMVHQPRRLPQLAGPPVLRTTPVQGGADPLLVQKALRSLAVGLVAAAITGFHGYKRNDSLLWGLVWAAGGFVCPIVAIPVAVSQGYANRKKA